VARTYVIHHTKLVEIRDFLEVFKEV